MTGMTGDGGDNVYRELAETYDEAAVAIGWKGPLLVFGLMSGCIRPGQTVLDIGIGTGLGSEPFFRAGLRITGMDVSDTMLAVCRRKDLQNTLSVTTLHTSRTLSLTVLLTMSSRPVSSISSPTLT